MIFILVFIVSLSIVVFAVVLIGLIFLYPSQNSKNTATKAYKHTKVDVSTGEISIGKAILDAEEFEINTQTNKAFIFYEGEGSLHLLSNFGDEVFQCSGSCYCGEYERRGDTKLTTLVSGMTSLNAKEEAKSVFEKECEELEIEENCSLLEAVVDKCSTTSSSSYDANEEAKLMLTYEEEQTKVVSTKNPNDLVYLCSGYCVPQEYRRKSRSTKEKCKKLKLVDITTIILVPSKYEESESFTEQQQRQQQQKEETEEEDLLERMKIDFYIQNLNPFCEQNSLRKSWLQDDIAHGLKWCTGLDVLLYNENLDCRKMGKRGDFTEEYLDDMFVQDLHREFFRPE